MAITKLGVLVAGIRGTVGGITFSQNGSATYAKIWSRSSNPRQPLQSEQRGTFGSMPQLWRDLTDAQRTAWDTFAALPAQERTNPLGDPFFASGFNWFNIVNGWLTNIGRTLRVLPPVLPRPSAPVIASLQLPFLPQQTAKITYPSGEFDPDFDIIIEIVVAISRGRTIPPSNFQSLLQSQLPGDTETAFLIEYLNRNGLAGPSVKGFTRVYRQTDDGQRSSAGTASFLAEDAAPFAAAAITYDGTTDFSARGADLTGNADTQTITHSLFFRINGGAATAREYLSGAIISYQFLLDGADTIIFQLNDTTGTTAYEFHSTETFAADGAWHHACFSVDSVADRITLAIDGQLTAPIITTRVPNSTFEWTVANHFVGQFAGFGNFWDGCLSMLYFNPAAALDFTNPDNIRLFIDQDGAPVDLGPSGEFPTGVIPILFLPDGDGANNQGSGGNYINANPVGACADTPP